MNSEKQKRYFAAANTGEGFKSYFEEIFFSDNVTRRYIIKGGPGTGKSSFMKRIALCAALKGHEVEYYYCSSDTRSLDGLLIDGKIAVFDGTAPHSYDTVLPGARDEIINLGDFWDSEALGHNTVEIERLCGEKKSAYSSAYDYLGVALAAAKRRLKLSWSFANQDKMTAAAERVYSKLRLDKGTGVIQTRQCSALGAYGGERFDTLEALAQRKWLIEEHYGIGGLFLSQLLELARRNGAGCVVSRNIVCSEIPDEIYFPQTGDWFGISHATRSEECADVQYINMKRFANAELIASLRREYRALNRMCDELVLLAAAALERAGKAHSELETYYVRSMDFSKQSDFCTRFIEKMKL